MTDFNDSNTNILVRFVGYCGMICDTDDQDRDLAYIDFFTGGVSLFADDGFLFGPDRKQLSSSILGLPAYSHELRGRQEANKLIANEPVIQLQLGGNRIGFNAAAVVDKFIEQLSQHQAMIAPWLGEIETVGSAIERLPYAEYIAGIEQTGLCRVIFYGDAYSEDGRLVYRPQRQEFLVDASGFELSPMDAAQFGVTTQARLDRQSN